MNTVIQKISARQVLDCKARPMLEVDVFTQDGSMGRVLLGRLVGQLVGLPQLVQKLLLLHGGSHLPLLQYGDLPLHGQQLVVLGPAVLVRLVALSLQGQLFVAQGADLLAADLILRPQLLEACCLLPDLLGELAVLLLILADEGLVLLPGTSPAKVVSESVPRSAP